MRHGDGESTGEGLLTPAEVAALFRVDPKTVTRWATAGKLTSLRTLGGHRRYRAAEVHALLRGASTGTPAPALDSTVGPGNPLGAEAPPEVTLSAASLPPDGPDAVAAPSVAGAPSVPPVSLAGAQAATAGTDTPPMATSEAPTTGLVEAAGSTDGV